MHNPGTVTSDRFPAQDRFADGAQYIAGRLAKGISGRTHAVVDPATGQEVRTCEPTGPDDIDAAGALITRGRTARPPRARRCSARCTRSSPRGLPSDGDDEGIRPADDTPYGLAAPARSRSVHRANRATREIRAGCVWISFEECTRIKHVMVDTTAVARKDRHRTVFGDR